VGDVVSTTTRWRVAYHLRLRSPGHTLPRSGTDYIAIGVLFNYQLTNVK